ncbi:MAG: carbohydrate ABC transporter permease [Candidatus Rokubacteria bacterium]|nr:carbohydrate ABC transporter permease [Candidatus Rokubacteria bacterium]
MARATGPRLRTIGLHAVNYGTLLLACAFVLFPLLWGLITSLKDPSSVTAYPPRWIPDPVTLDNYRVVIGKSTMPTYFANSIVVSLSTVLLTLVLGVHAGYAAARFSFRFKNALLFYILSTVMIPGIAILVPLYMIAIWAGLYDKLVVLVLIYAAWQVPTTTWVMRGFFAMLPRELEESALIDGCSRLGAFYRIILPLAWPGLSAAAILTFIYAWNEFIIALTLTLENANRLVPIGLYFYVSEFGIPWGQLTAAVMIAIVPPAVFFALLQKKFIQGLSSGAIKG